MLLCQSLLRYAVASSAPVISVVIMPAFTMLEQCQLVGIVESDDARAGEICEEYGCERFATAEQLGEACAMP